MYYIYLENQVGYDTFKWQFYNTVISLEQKTDIVTELQASGERNILVLEQLKSWNETKSQDLVISVQGDIYQIMEYSGRKELSNGKLVRNIANFNPSDFIPYKGTKRTGERDLKWIGC